MAGAHAQTQPPEAKGGPTTRRARRTVERTFKSSATRGVDCVQRGIRILARAVNNHKAPPTAEEQAAVEEAWRQLKGMGDAIFENPGPSNGHVLNWERK